MKLHLNSRMAASIAMAVLTLGAGLSRGATILPLEQKRCVSASAVFVTPTNAAACASQFSAFDGTVHLGWPSRIEPWSLDAAQQSQIGATSISATGTVSLAFAHPLVSGSVTNEFRVGFRLTQPVNFALAGSIVWDGTFGPFGSSSPVVRLTGPQGVVFETEAALNDGTPVAYNNMGSLPAGQYLIEAYAGSGSDFGGGETMSVDLDFQVTPTGPPVAGDPVYQLTGALLGLDQQGDAIKTRLFTPQILVNLALGLPNNSPAPGSTLGLVMNCAGNVPSRIVVWDNHTSNAVVELGTLQVATALGSSSDYTAVGEIDFADRGGIVGTLGSVNSKTSVLVSARKTAASSPCVNSAALGSLLGQMFLREDGTTNTVLIRAGAFTTTRKLGNLQ